MPKDFDRVQARINALLSEGNLTAARDVLQRITPVAARFPKAAEWCRRTAARLKDFEAKRTNQALLLQTAQQLVDAFDYEQAQSLLAPIAVAERSARVCELLADVEQIIEELRVLEEDLVDAVRREDLDEIKSIIDRLLELRPSHRLAREVQRNFGKIRRGRMLLTVGPTGQVELHSGSSMSSPVAVWGLAAIALVVTYQVTVADVTGPQGDSLLAGRRAFVGAGILVWADERNYVRLERAAMQGGLRDTVYANWELRENGRFARAGTTGEMPLSGNATWLRVQRRGNQLIGSVSEDGATWKDLLPLTVNWPQDIQIGIAAVNNTPIGYEARFANRTLTTN